MPGREFSHSPQGSAEDKNELSCNALKEWTQKFYTLLHEIAGRVSRVVSVVRMVEVRVASICLAKIRVY